MLEDCLIDSRSSASSKKPATMILSILVHGSLIVALVLIPLFQIPLLPQVSGFAPLAPPSAGPRAIELVPAGGARSAATSSAPIVQSAALTVPTALPTDIVKYVDLPAGSCVGCLPTTGAGNGPLGIPGGVDFTVDGPRVAPPTPPAPPPAPPKAPPPDPVPTGPVPMTSRIMQSKLISMVQPEYPVLAARIHVEGVVVLEAVVTRNGTIDAGRLRVVRGHPMLAPAAVEAVRKWRYQPTVLNGEPVEVLAEITVNFTLN